MWFWHIPVVRLNSNFWETIRNCSYVHVTWNTEAQWPLSKSSVKSSNLIVILHLRRRPDVHRIQLTTWFWDRIWHNSMFKPFPCNQSLWDTTFRFSDRIWDTSMFKPFPVNLGGIQRLRFLKRLGHSPITLPNHLLGFNSWVFCWWGAFKDVTGIHWNCSRRRSGSGLAPAWEFPQQRDIFFTIDN